MPDSWGNFQPHRFYRGETIVTRRLTAAEILATSSRADGSVDIERLLHEFNFARASEEAWEAVSALAHDKDYVQRAKAFHKRSMRWLTALLAVGVLVLVLVVATPVSWLFAAGVDPLGLAALTTVTAVAVGFTALCTQIYLQGVADRSRMLDKFIENALSVQTGARSGGTSGPLGRTPEVSEPPSSRAVRAGE